MKYQSLGHRLKEIREKAGESITATSKSIGVDRSYLSRIEAGHTRPSRRTLKSLISHFLVEGMEAINLYSLASYEMGFSISTPGVKSGVYAPENNPQSFNYPEGKEFMRKEEQNMEKKVQPNAGLQVNMPAIPVLYTDSCFVSATDFGIVFDFAQTVGPTNQQNVVARVGMSREHAEAVVKVLSQKLADTRLDNLKKKKES